jgi:tripartite-type tricarboxylate transporter receptor subunit TctC
MKATTRSIRSLLAAFAVCLAASAQAQGWPSKPIRVIVPFTPGGSTDIVARQLGEKLSTALGQPVVIENKPGAGGTIGTDMVAKSAPDGYTLLVIPGAHTINASLYAGLPYDPVKDFEPVIQIAVVATMVVVNPSVPVKSIDELLKLAQAHPGTLNYGSAGTGTVTHMTGELFNLMSGAGLRHVPYKGSSQALTDLIGGQVQVMFANFPGTLQHVQAGRLRVLAVNGVKRSPLLPETPTVAESGISGYDANTWYGVLAPAGTPAAIVARLNTELARALDSPEIRKTLAAEGGEVVAGTPEQFAAFLRQDIAKWAKVVKASGAKVTLR